MRQVTPRYTSLGESPKTSNCSRCFGSRLLNSSRSVCAPAPEHSYEPLLQARPDLSVQDITALLVSLTNLSLSCYPDKLEYVDQILGFAHGKIKEYGDKLSRVMVITIPPSTNRFDTQSRCPLASNRKQPRVPPRRPDQYVPICLDSSRYSPLLIVTVTTTVLNQTFALPRSYIVHFEERNDHRNSGRCERRA